VISRSSWTSLVAPLAASALLAGCLAPPVKQDPFAQLEHSNASAPPAYPGLALAVVVTANTKNSMAYARQGAAMSMGAFDPDKPFNDLIVLLKRNFKSVVTVDSAEGGRASGADVVGVTDVYAAVARTIFGDIKIDQAILFLDPAGSTIDKVAVSEKKGVGEASSFSLIGQNRIVEALNNVENDVAKAFAEQLAASAPLHDYAKSRSGAAAPRVAEAPAPAARTVNSDVDVPSYKADEDPSKFALVIGVESYESLPPADDAEHDAAAVRRHLLALGYPERNVIVLTGPKAGKAGIEKYVESWLPRNVDENAQVFVYFAGHGAPDPKTGRAYLVPWDGDAKYLENTGYPIKRLYDRLGALKAKRVVVALDSCFSGAGGRSVLAKGARPLVTQIDAAVPASDKLVVLAASAGDEITGTLESQGHGLFTYYLLKGLNERGGRSSARALYDFLKPKVQDAARRDGRDQTPQLQPASESATTRL
jgi:hypothetical protein